MSDDLPLMPKATAVWLVDNTTLTFRQIADFCGMHELEIAGIADGEVAQGIKGFDPVRNNQLTAREIARCEGDPLTRLRLMHREVAPPVKKKAPRYTPVSKRQDRPAAIAWLVRYHPELETSAIAKLVGSTKQTIEAIRTRSHWNSANIQPIDPVALGLCKQIDLDRVVAEAQLKKAKNRPAGAQGDGLMTTEESLAREVPPFFIPEDDEDENPRRIEDLDPEALFNLPKSGKNDPDSDD